jgi:hypothetical protein
MDEYMSGLLVTVISHNILNRKIRGLFLRYAKNKKPVFSFVGMEMDEETEKSAIEFYDGFYTWIKKFSRGMEKWFGRPRINNATLGIRDNFDELKMSILANGLLSTECDFA